MIKPKIPADEEVRLNALKEYDMFDRLSKTNILKKFYAFPKIK